jgi:hypothetical protein
MLMSSFQSINFRIENLVAISIDNFMNKEDNQKFNQTYVIVIINNAKIVTLNRKYLPTCSRKEIDESWSNEYIQTLLSSSETIDKKKILKLKTELKEHSTLTKFYEEKENKFEFFWIYNGIPELEEMKKIREKISQILKCYTGFKLEYFE